MSIDRLEMAKEEFWQAAVATGCADSPDAVLRALHHLLVEAIRCLGTGEATRRVELEAAEFLLALGAE